MRPQYAILLDGGFLTKKLHGRLGQPPSADDIVGECARLQSIHLVAEYELLRIYFYDAYPSAQVVTRPVSKQQWNLGTTKRFQEAQRLHDQLILRPHFALRMGNVAVSPQAWKLKPQVVQELKTSSRALADSDFDLDIQQKGVDMRIGLDMARLAFREMVRSVIVVTGDSDFVPAFKLARREGMKIILEPMGHNVNVALRQHADVVL